MTRAFAVGAGGLNLRPLPRQGTRAQPADLHLLLGMRTHHGRFLALALGVALAGCAPTPGSTETAPSVEPSVPGLGLYDVAEPYAYAVGHTGEHIGYEAWAGCRPEDGAVVVVLSNRAVENLGGMAQPLVDAVRSV
jgi:hypothetical protein